MILFDFVELIFCLFDLFSKRYCFLVDFFFYLLLSTLASVCLIFMYLLIIGAACEEGKAAASANDNNVISHNKGKKALCFLVLLPLFV